MGASFIRKPYMYSSFEFSLLELLDEAFTSDASRRAFFSRLRSNMAQYQKRAWPASSYVEKTDNSIKVLKTSYKKVKGGKKKRVLSDVEKKIPGLRYLGYEQGGVSGANVVGGNLPVEGVQSNKIDRLLSKLSKASYVKGARDGVAQESVVTAFKLFDSLDSQIPAEYKKLGQLAKRIFSDASKGQIPLYSTSRGVATYLKKVEALVNAGLKAHPEYKANKDAFFVALAGQLEKNHFFAGSKVSGGKYKGLNWAKAYTSMTGAKPGEDIPWHLAKKAGFQI